MVSKINTVLESWYILESIQPKELPKLGGSLEGKLFLHQEKVPKIAPIELSEKPWKKHVLNDDKKNSIQFQYYMNCYEQWQLTEKVRAIFNSDEEIHVKDTSLKYSYTFSVNYEGKYIEGSLFIPFVQYLLKALENGSNYDKNLEQYEVVCRKMEEEAIAIFTDGVSEEKIHDIQHQYNQYFRKPFEYSYHQLQITVLNKNNKNKNEQMTRNSFFIEDIERVLQNGVNATLKDFIVGSEKQIDIDNNRALIEQILQPKNLPLGRWPSPVAHRLSLMQQVAVNRIINGDERLHSVNGPPGTGKTTLLKDVFADIVVQRAVEMTAFSDPTTAFRKIGIFELNGFKNKVYEMNENLKSYSIVVASSNNGAVENISKDLPKRKEIVKPEKNDAGIIKPGIKNEYDQKIAEYLEELDYYPSTAKKLINYADETWGLFSGIFGKSKNIDNFIWGLLKDDGDLSFVKQLQRDNEMLSTDDWQKAVEEFNTLLRSIEQKKDDLQKYIELDRELQKLEEEFKTLEQDQSRITINLSLLQVQQEEIAGELNSLKKPNFFFRILGTKNQNEKNLRQQQKQIEQDLIESERIALKISKYQGLLKDQKENILQASEKFKAEYSQEELELSTDEYWEFSNNDYRQQKVIWQTDKLNYERGLLFLKAMKIHKLFLIKNHQIVSSSLRLFANRKALNLNSSEHRKYLKNFWHVIHLVTPLISTTFASFANMYKGIEQDFISHLFIDEAGQASPQLAVGALWRSKKAVIVGDPIQIEPVVTVDETLLMDIRKCFALEQHYIGYTASVQSIADIANPYGTFKDEDRSQWIGIPLWVHRRCLNPMFSIANDIAYDNKMVLADTDKVGYSGWIDCVGKVSTAQYVKKQGEYVAQVIFDKYTERNGLPNLFVITPFTAVKDGLKKAIHLKLKPLQVPNLSEWLDEAVGTVHTFQGKEADIVYFVTGTDEQTEGAANWTCSKPNLLNVAATRAKKEFYVIGDLKRFSKKNYYDKIVHYMDLYKKNDPFESENTMIEKSLN
ncbi:AAA domain-containing protein [Lysinibacillus sp. NPDC093688]|uniref:DEAD/DEAH box helicase n=1 Tax=Lysinibacillus sp. NPDC093688 TaxID=3390577 RepID=UPI003D05855A